MALKRLDTTNRRLLRRRTRVDDQVAMRAQRPLEVINERPARARSMELSRRRPSEVYER